MKLLGKYKNGNYHVMLFDDGTKVRRTNDDEFVPSFSENSDVKITDKCQIGCPFCYEGCTPNGKHAELDFKSQFFKSLHPYTELAINGNDMDHPQLRVFLEFLKDKKVVTNVTLNQKQLEKNFELVKELQDEGLLFGIGVSLVKADEILIKMLHGLKNTVLHTICGVLTKTDIDMLKDKGIKILILGYKDLQRGHDYKNSHGDEIQENKMYLYTILPKMPEWFKVVSFDSLSIEQLNVKRIMTDEEWEEFYMGDDGQYTFYIDLVKKEYAMNSLAHNRFPIGDKTVDEMFAHVRTLEKETL